MKISLSLECRRFLRYALLDFTVQASCNGYIGRKPTKSSISERQLYQGCSCLQLPIIISPLAEADAISPHPRTLLKICFNVASLRTVVKPRIPHSKINSILVFHINILIWPKNSLMTSCQLLT